MHKTTIKRLMIFALFVLLFPAAALSETKYVTDLKEITMRTGQGLDHKIVAMLKSGQSLQVLNAKEDWTQVRLPNGKEGWVLSRFLTSSEPKALTLEKLEKKHEGLTQQVNVLMEENQELKAENQRLSSELETKNKEINRLKTAYETLKKDASDYVTLKSSHEQATERLQELSKKATRLESDLSSIRKQQSIRWFLAGAGVLMVGFIVGFSSRKKQKRSSLL